MYKKIVIDLNRYESRAEIERSAMSWNEVDESSVSINRYAKLRLLPCTFKHILHESVLPEFEKLRLMKDGIDQVLSLIKTDNQNSLYYIKNIQCILELEVRDTSIHSKYLDKIPADDFWKRATLDQALKDMRQI